MAISDFTLVALVTFLLGGGGSSDLLDYLPTESYWQAKQVVVTTEGLLAELKPPPAVADIDDLIAALGAADAADRDAAAARIKSMGAAAIPALQKEAESDDVEIAQRAKSLVSEINASMKPAAVRRLMAIRTLGERRAREGLETLRPLMESREPFVAAYARRAVAQIEGKPVDSILPAEALRQDLWLLPDNCAAVGQFKPRAGLAQRFDAAIEPMHILPRQKQERLTALTEYVLELSDHVGNLRIDGVTFGVSDDYGPASGFLVAIARGQFDRAAVAERVRQEGSPSGNVEGFDVFQLEGGAALFFPSDELAVYMLASDPAKLPTRAMIAAARAGKGGLAEAGGLRELIEKASTDQPLWAVAKVTPALREFPVAAGFDRAALVGRQNGARFTFEASGEGTDPKQVAISVHEIRRHLKGALDGMRNMAPVMPPLQRIHRFLESVKINADGPGAAGTATFEGPVTRLIVFMNFPYATARPVEEGKPMPPPRVPEPAPLNPEPEQ